MIGTTHTIIKEGGRSTRQTTVLRSEAIEHIAGMMDTRAKLRLMDAIDRGERINWDALSAAECETLLEYKTRKQCGGGTVTAPPYSASAPLPLPPPPAPFMPQYQQNFDSQHFRQQPLYAQHENVPMPMVMPTYQQTAAIPAPIIYYMQEQQKQPEPQIIYVEQKLAAPQQQMVPYQQPEQRPVVINNYYDDYDDGAYVNNGRNNNRGGNRRNNYNNCRGCGCYGGCNCGWGGAGTGLVTGLVLGSLFF